jgi:hypothetical protein
MVLWSPCSFMVIVVIREILEAPDFSSALKITFLGLLVVIGYRYCYLLEDLSPKLLPKKRSTLESLGDYLQFQGQEALLTEKESSNGAPTSHVDDPTNEFLGRSGKDYIQSNGINVVAIANSGGDQINDEYHSD